MAQLVAQLNDYRPAFVIGYASTIKLLTAEQEAGRLRIDPVLIQPAGETMTTDDTDRIARAFRATVRAMYSATECTYLSHSCARGWYHVNSDWAVLEPVDADHRPTPPGQFSHTVLISNLANRYNRSCATTSVTAPAPARPVPVRQPAARDPRARARRRHPHLPHPLRHPRTARPSGLRHPLRPHSWGRAVPGRADCPVDLRVRLLPTADADPNRVWQSAHLELTRLLADNKLDHVSVQRAEEPPRQTPGGKYRTVIPFDQPDTRL